MTSHSATPVLTLAISGPTLKTQNRLDLFQIESRAASVNQPLKNLIHLMTDLKNEIPTVFHLVIGVLVTEAASVAFFGIQSKAEAGAVNPTLADPWLNRPIAVSALKVSAIFAKCAASDICVKQFPSLENSIPAFRAWHATYS